MCTRRRNAFQWKSTRCVLKSQFQTVFGCDGLTRSLLHLSQESRKWDGVHETTALGNRQCRTATANRRKTNEISLTAVLVFFLEAISRLWVQGGVILTEHVRLAELRQRWERGRLRQLEVAGHISEKESLMLKKSPRHLCKGAFESLLSAKLYVHSVKVHKAGQETKHKLNNTWSTHWLGMFNFQPAWVKSPTRAFSKYSAETPKGVKIPEVVKIPSLV